jgi:hypothetical protein
MSHDNTLNVLADVGMAARRQEPVQVQARRQEPRTTLAVAEVECHDGGTLWTRTTAETVTAPTGPLVRVQRETLLDAFDPRDYEAEQPADIAVLDRHDRAMRVGRVLHLEWGQGEPARIHGVLEVDEDAAAYWAGREVFLSPGTKRNASGRLVLDHVALVESTARIGAAAVRWTNTTFERRHTWTPQTVPDRELLTRAHAIVRKRARGSSIMVVGHPGFDEQIGEQRASRDPGPLTPEYMRRNGENNLFYSGGIGRVVDVR